MAPAPLDIEVYIGDTVTVTTAVKNNGVPVNISGRAYAAQIRPTPSSDTVTATFTCTITDAANGAVTCTLPASVTATLSPTRACWDLQETVTASPENIRTTLVAGYANITQDVTR